jgi:hypothetical protein
MSAGYSGTPLAKKLGVKDGQRTWHVAMPATVLDEILAGGVMPQIVRTPSAGLDMAHIFVMQRKVLAKELKRLRGLLVPDGVVWVSWPKKAAKVETDVTEDVVRAEALPLGFVDVKVCAVDAVWSGLKLVIQKSERRTFPEGFRVVGRYDEVEASKLRGTSKARQ